MRPKLRHACERCGLEAVFERAGRFSDEDYLELLHEYFALEHDHQLTLAALSGARAGRDMAKARLHYLKNPVMDLLIEPEWSECEDPFGV